jgi:Cysteine-rich secretory protein family
VFEVLARPTSHAFRRLIPAGLLLVVWGCSSSAKDDTKDHLQRDSGSGGEGGTGHGGDASRACTAGQITVTVVDYFTGKPIDASATVDGASTGAALPCLTVAPGVHPFAIAASGYATFNDAIQVPGGATSRTVQLVPVTPSLASWLTLVNSDRMANGAGPLQLDNGLMMAAWDHAVDMGVHAYFAHFDPHGFAPTTRSLMLGSMVIAAEDIAVGQPTYVQAEASFMAERLKLPHQSPSDCATDYNLADHYCDIITPSHNWLGLGIADVPGSPYKTYFDQEFGDLYGYYDTTVLGPEPPPSDSAPLTLIAAPGDSFTYEYVQTMPAPTPVPIATLNEDPECSSMCPPGDLWYPTGNTSVTSGAPKAFTPSLNESQIVFVEITTSAKSFFGASVYAAFWGGGTVLPDTYGASALSYRVE